MLSFRCLVVCFIFLLILPVSVIAENNQTPSDTQQRIQWIQNALDEGTTHAKLWQYGWTGFFGATTTANCIKASDKKDNESESENNERFDATVSATTSFLAFGSMLFDPLKAHTAAKKLRRMPETTPDEQAIKLAEAEKLLAHCARRQERGRSWQTHALSAFVNLVAGVIVATDGDREDDALKMFATSMVVSEIQVFTTPTRAIDDLATYRSGNFTRKISRKSSPFYVGVFPGGIKLNYCF